MVLSHKTIRRLNSSLIYLLLLVGTILMFIPFWWTLITAFKTASDTAKFPIVWFPTRFTLEWVASAWRAKFPVYYMNSIIVAVVVVISNVVTSALAGYIFAKFNFRFRGVLFMVITDPHLLVAVQLLDGICAAVFGVLVPLTIADVTRGTGRFNLAQGIVGSGIGIGASLSTALAGWMSDRLGSSVAFLGLACVGGAGLVLAALLMPETKERKDDPKLLGSSRN